MMRADQKEKSGHDILHRVLEEASFREKKKEEAQDFHDMLEAVQALTNLTKAELEEITIKVRAVQEKDSFFSIKQQAMMVSMFLLVLFCLPALGVWKALA
jgi:negative regulator of replication initiation